MNSAILPQWSSLRPRYGNAMLALLAVGAALVYAVLDETPRGRLAGAVTNRDTEAVVPFARVVASGPEGTHYTRADAKGRYAYNGLAAGDWSISAYSRSEAFRVSDAAVVVDEGETAELPLALKRTQPDLQQTQQQSVFLPTEKAFFPVHGYVDPAKKHTDVLRVKVWKARLFDLMQNEATAQALAKVASRWQRPAVLPPALLKTKGLPAPQLISDNYVPIREADAEGFYHKRVPLSGDAGLYLIQVAHTYNKKIKVVCGWMNITSTALVMKQSPTQAIAFVTNLQSGAPRPGFAVRVYHEGKPIAAALTNADGLAKFPLPAYDEGRIVAVAQQGGEEALLDRSLYQPENSGSVVTYVYTDRPIYRPGQKISFKGLTRHRSLSPSASKATDSTTGSSSVTVFQQAGAMQGTAVDVEVRDPSGTQVFKKQDSLNGFGSFAGDFELSPEATTGNYSLVTTIDGKETSHDITVAAYRKPEFEVTVTPGKPRYFVGEGMQMEIAAKYYFGSPVAGAKVRYSIYRAGDWSANSDYDEEYEEYGYGESVRDGEGVLDETGKLIVSFSAHSAEELEKLLDAQSENSEERAPTELSSSDFDQTQIFTAHATVIDPAEREAEGEGKARLVAGDFALSVEPQGYVAQPGQQMIINIKARDHDGKPVKNLPIALEMGYWRRDGEASSEDERTSKSTFVTIRALNLTTNGTGIATDTIKPPRAGELQLTARAKDSAGRGIQNKNTLWVASETGDYGDYGSYASDLALYTDKKRYDAGQTARVLINSAQIGQSVLLTLEGERIYRSWVIPIKLRSTIFQMPLEDEFGPNIYLTACYVKARKFAQSEIPLRVHVPNREVQVKIRADKSDYAPGAKVNYAVQTLDAKGKPISAEFSFGVVDESIYALREDDPEALTETFYPRRTNQVSTSHSFATEYLGDANKAALKIEPRRKFLDTAFWKPFGQTDANGMAQISLSLPDNLTKWRATAVAQTQSSAFGYGVQKVTASKDFFVRLEKPRFLTQNDNGQLTAFIHNETGQVQQAGVRLTLSGLETSLDKDRQTEIAPGQVGQITWPVAAKTFGEATITLAAWTNGNRFTDALEEKLPVRPHGRELLSSVAGQVTTTKSETIKVDGKALAQASHLKVRLTPSVISALTGGLEYLTGYPYGCVEQTLSRFLPDVLVSRILRGVGDEKSRRLQAELPKMVRDGLTRLYKMQHASGAWGWWEYDADDAWMTSYVLYGLASAQQAGFAVDEERLANGRKGALALMPKVNEPHRAFLLYALALTAKTPAERTAVAQERGKTNWRGWDGGPIAYLLLTDKLLNLSDPKLEAAFERRAVFSDDMTYWKHWPSGKWNSWDYDYNDNTATAMALRAILARNPTDPRVPGILRWLMGRRTGGYWESTRDTSCVLAALADYIEANPEATQMSGTLNVKLNGALLKSFTLSPKVGSEADLQLEVPGAKLRSGANTFVLERMGGGSPVFYSLQLRQTIGGEDLTPLPGSLKITREYLRVTRPERSNRWRVRTEPTKNQLRQGDQIRVQLTFEAPRDMAYVLIEDAYPSGCEASERGTVDQEVNGDSYRYGYASIEVSNVDVRDDRIAFFARKVPAGKHTITYHLRAQTPGTYHVMPAQLQAMYDPSTRAESGENRVEVK